MVHFGNRYAALLNRLTGINGYPILLDAPDTRTFIEAMRRIAPVFSGIQLSNVSSQYCFDIVPALDEELNLPVIHDDQQGNATVIVAALINACKTCEQDLTKVKIGVLGTDY